MAVRTASSASDHASSVWVSPQHLVRCQGEIAHRQAEWFAGADRVEELLPYLDGQPLSPVFVLLFAATYFVMSGVSEGNFNEPLTRTDALYFTVTVFATVGFGDIVATTQGARVLVMGQMVAGIVIIGLGVRIFVDAVKRGHRGSQYQGATTPEADSRLE